MPPRGPFLSFQHVQCLMKQLPLRTTTTVGSDFEPLFPLDLSKPGASPFLCEKINANLPQRRHCPHWHSRHVASVRLAKVSKQEFWVPVLNDGCSNFAHQSEQVMHIMHAQSMQARSAACPCVVPGEVDAIDKVSGTYR